MHGLFNLSGTTIVILAICTTTFTLVSYLIVSKSRALTRRLKALIGVFSFTGFGLASTLSITLWTAEGAWDAFPFTLIAGFFILFVPTIPLWEWYEKSKG